MAVIKSGILSTPKGTIGNVVSFKRFGKGILQGKSRPHGRTIASGGNPVAAKMIELKSAYELMGQDVQNVFFSKNPYDNYYYYQFVKMNFKNFLPNGDLDLLNMNIVRNELARPNGYYAYTPPEFNRFIIKVASYENVPSIRDNRDTFTMMANLNTFEVFSSFSTSSAPSLNLEIFPPSGTPGDPFVIFYCEGQISTKYWTPNKVGFAVYF